MKQLLLIISMLLLTIDVSAGDVSREQAREIASQFLKEKSIERMLSPVDAQKPLRRSSGGADCFHVFNVGQNQGFVIVSGDDRTPEILGYSLSGSFDIDNLPPAMEALLNHYSEEIRQIQEGRAVAAVRRAPHSSVAQMMTVKWGQDDPYNRKTMTGYYTNGNSFQCVTGCVATAMAQVLYHQHFVNKTQAEIPGYQNAIYYMEGTGYMNAVPAGSVLDWGHMVDSYNGSETEAQKDAVASLMMYCGVAVHMTYSYNASSASVADIPEAFKKYFGYSRGTRYVTRSSYAADDWDNLIYNEIASGRPVIFGGTDQNGGGHAFILHGYDGNGRYAVNWGWGGYEDNYFMLDDLTPPSQATSGGYNYDQDAVIYLAKEDGSFKEDVVATVCGTAIGDMTVDNNNYFVMPTGQSYEASRNYAGGVSFALALTYTSDLANNYYFDLGYGVQNSDGNLVGDVVMLSNNWDLKQGLWRTTATGNTNFFSGWSEGTYYIKAYSRENGTQDWHVCKDADKFAVKMVVSSSAMKFEVVDISTPDPEPQPEPVATVTLNKKEVVVKKNKTVTLKATVTPETVPDKSVTWKSSDTKIATVTSDGTVKGVKTGTVTITCTSVATGAKATCKVTVATITLDQTNVVVRKNKTVTLTPTVYPTTLEDKSVKWKSSDKTIATVSSSGVVKGVKTGTVTITCTSVATGLSATCKVTVGTITLDQTKVVVRKNKTVTLTPTVYPTTLTDKSVKWESSDKTIATVSSSGVVKGVKTGTVTITCTSVATGLSATCAVTVGTITLDKTKVVVRKNKTVKLTPTVYPTTLADKRVKWQSSDKKIATVASDGTVTGVKTGIVTITCTSVATGLSTTCEVTVGTITLDQTSVTVVKGNTVKLTPTVYPTTLTDKSVMWKSSKTTVATVSEDGTVKGVKAGTATITCTSVATGLSTTCKVTVTASSGARTLDEEDADVTGIEIVETPAIEEPFDVYDLGGRQVLQRVTSLDGLPAGVYIVNGKKVMKK